MTANDELSRVYLKGYQGDEPYKSDVSRCHFHHAGELW